MLDVLEDARGVSSPHPHTTWRSCVSIGKIAAMISTVNSTASGAEAEPAAAKTTQKQKQRQVQFMVERIVANFRTDAQKLALSEKCLQSLSQF